MGFRSVVGFERTFIKSDFLDAWKHAFRTSALSIQSEPLVSRNYTNDADSIERQQTVFVALAGAPNAGKSTLLNALVGQKISAVSQKTNTTSRKKVGYFEEGSTQAIIIDTPGVVEKRQYMDQKHGERVESAWNTAGSSDLALLIVDGYRQLSRPDPRVITLIETFKHSLGVDGIKNVPRTALVLTKADKCSNDPRNLVQISEYLLEISETEKVFLVSGLRGTGMSALRKHILSCSKRSPWIDNESLYGNQIPAVAGEIIREKIFRAYYKEVPYAIRITAVNVHQTEKEIWIQARLDVPSSSMKTIVIGTKGAAISSVERAVECEISNMYKKDAHVSIGVQCNP